MPIGGFPLLQVNRSRGVSGMAAAPLTLNVESFGLLDMFVARQWVGYQADSGNAMRQTGASNGGSTTQNGNVAVSQVDGFYEDFGNVAVINTISGWRDTPGFPHARMTQNPFMSHLIKTGPDVTDIRMFVGIKDGAAFFVNNDNPDDGCVCFRFSTAAGDTKWTPVTSPDGVTGWTFGTPMGPNVAANTVYLLQCGVVNGVATFLVGSGPVGSVTAGAITMSAAQTINTNIPIGTNAAYPVCQQTNLTAAAKNFYARGALLTFGAVYDLGGAV